MQKVLLIVGRELGPIDGESNLERSREVEWRLIVRVVDAGERVRSDIQALVELQDKRDSVLHLLSGDMIAINLQHTCTALANALKSNSSVCLPGASSGPSQRTRFRPTRFPEEDRLVLQDIEA